MSEKAITKLTPRVNHPGRTQEFIVAIRGALDTFEDEISSLTDDIRGKAYKNYVGAYRDALIPVWISYPTQIRKHVLLAWTRL